MIRQNRAVGALLSGEGIAERKVKIIIYLAMGSIKG